MADHNPSEQTASKAQGPTSTEHHAYDAPNISAKEFLLRVMHDPDAPIKDRIRAASALLRIYPHDWDPPRLKYIIGGIPECHSLSQSEALEPEVERTEINSQKREARRITLSHSGELKAPANIETIIEDIKSGNYPEPTLCTICGEFMPYPCYTTKN
jgi:hypothetical protein